MFYIGFYSLYLLSHIYLDPTKNQPPAQHQQVASSPDGEDDPILNDPEVPRDAKVMSMILKSMGVDQYEPRVVNQILEFMYSTYPYSSFTGF